MFYLLQLFSVTFPLFIGLFIFSHYYLWLCLWLYLTYSVFNILCFIRNYLSLLYHLLALLHTLFSCGFICGFTAPPPLNSFHYNNTSCICHLQITNTFIISTSIIAWQYLIHFYFNSYYAVQYLSSPITFYLLILQTIPFYLHLTVHLDICFIYYKPYTILYRGSMPCTGDVEPSIYYGSKWPLFDLFIVIFIDIF